MVTVAAMRTHAEAICNHKSKAIAEWTAETSPIRELCSYATVMREIGHCLGRYQRSRRSFVREVWAWEGARRNALLWTPQLERSAQAALNWHRHRVKTGLTRAKRLDWMKARCQVERSITQCRES